MKIISLILTVFLTTQPACALPTESGTLTLPQKFTGKRLDKELGLYDFGARSYDPVFSRFLTPDTAGPTYTDPQTLNPYAYTRNNPVKLVDPTGEAGVLALWQAAVWAWRIFNLYVAVELTFVSLPQDIQRYREAPSLVTGAQVGLDAAGAIAAVAGAGITKTGVQAVESVGARAVAGEAVESAVGSSRFPTIKEAAETFEGRIRQRTLQREAESVRVFRGGGPGESQLKGQFSTSERTLRRARTPEGVKEVLAIPGEPPTQVGRVRFPPGTKVFVGKGGEGTQIFTEQKDLSRVIFKHLKRLEEFLEQIHRGSSSGPF